MSVLRTFLAEMNPRDLPRMQWNRVNNLIDGVYGFAATILVVNLSAPDYEPGHLGDTLLDQAPEYLLYILGFLQILGAWSVLRRMSQWTTGIDYYGMLLALLSMAIWATTPFTIDVLSEAVNNRDDFTSAVRLMAIVLLVSMINYSLLVRHLLRRGYFKEGLQTEPFALAMGLSVTAFMWPLTALLLTFVIGAWALVLIVLLSVLALLPIDAMTTEQHAEVH